jgi:hypothetical protein
MKTAIMLLICAILLFTVVISARAEVPAVLIDLDTLRSVSEVEVHKHSYAVILGKLQKFTPWTEGKGRNVMYWKWEIVLPEGGRFPVTSNDKSDGESINFAEYEGEYVRLYTFVYYGIVIGDSNPDRQSATGYRLDATGIEIWNEGAKFRMLPDTCGVWGDLERNQNKEIIAAGKLIEYMPPNDGSKLGDEKIWDWELRLPDGYTIPIGRTNSSLNLESFKDKDVYVEAYLKYGIIFGDSNTANMQGYRLDILNAALYETGPIEPSHRLKVKFDLGEFTEDGLRQRIHGEGSSINYEFCIPADEEAVKEVTSIDATAKIHKGSKGRSGCSESEWLVIGESRQSNFKDVIKSLAKLKYVREISETFWE